VHQQENGPKFESLTLHYANTWNGIADHPTTNYQYSHYLTNPISTTRIVQAGSSDIYTKDQQNTSTNEQMQHWVLASYDFNPNARSAFNLNFHGSSTVAQDDFRSVASGHFY